MTGVNHHEIQSSGIQRFDFGVYSTLTGASPVALLQRIHLAVQEVQEMWV